MGENTSTGNIPVRKKSSWHGPKQIGIMIFAGAMMLFGTALVGGNTNTILPAFAEQYGWDINFLRTVAGIGSIFTVVGTFVFGSIIQKKGPKFGFSIALIITAVLISTYGFISNLTLFIIVIFIVGFLSGGFKTSGANSLVANWWPTKKGIVLGFVTMGIPLMDIVYQPFVPQAFGRFGIAPTMIVIGVIVLVVAIIGILFIKNTPEETGEYPDGDSSNPEDLKAVVKEMREYKSPFSFKKVFLSRATFDIGLGMGLLFMVGMTYIASIVPRLLSVGYEYSFAVLVLMVCGGAAGIVGSWLIGLLDLKVGTKRACLVFAALLGVAMVMALFHSIGPAFVWVASAVFAFSLGACGNLIPSYILTVYGRWDYPAAYKVIGSLTELLAGIGITLTGLFHGNYVAMYIFDIVVIVIAFFILLRSKDKLIGKAG